ncbi:MAG: DNA-binding response OmpR family regulator [Clostridium sp.]|jgi:DNA-binding response OmpR family regulator
MLMEKCLNVANQNSTKKIILYTNHILISAIALYKKYDFKEITLVNNKYIESDLKMELKYLIILDRMLRIKEGVEILKAIRTNGIKTPVIFLTAKDSITDRVTGLDAGADDYLIKPFSTEELLARVRALSRRQFNLVESNSIQFLSTVFELLKGEVVFGGETIQLTAKESQLLELLMKNKNQVMTRELILDRVWGMESEVDVNSIELYVYYLRKKLKNSKCNISIKTIR